MQNKIFVFTALFSIFPPILFFASATVAAEERFPGIKALMTAEELEASGVNELSRREIEALNRWLIRYTANEAPVLQAENEELIEVVKKGMSSKIVGQFDGWSGKTRFHLENGQVFEQRRPGRWKITLDNPEVLVTQNFMGAYELKIVAEERSIGVRRISR